MKTIKKVMSLSLIAVMVLGVLAGCSAGKSDADEVIEKINTLEQKNAYIQLMVGQDQYIYLLYNKDGEALAESSNGGIAFYRKDNKIVTLTDTEVIINSDLNPLAFIKATAKVAEVNGTVEKEVKTNEESNTKNTLYTMTVDGKENIKKVYDTVGDEGYSTESIEMLYSGFEDIETSKMTLRVSTGEKGELGAVCSVTFGEGEENEYTSWTFDGYIETFDWAYDEKWYSNDTDDVEAWIDLASETVSEISNKMAEFMRENNLMVEESETGQITPEQFAGMSDEEKSTTIEKSMEDVTNYGFDISCTKEDLLKAIKDYYANEENNKVNLLQAVINVGTENGWITETFVEGEQNNNSNEGDTEGTGEVNNSDNTGTTE